MTSRHASAYGPDGRLGLIVPPTNTVNEAEWRLMLPPAMSFHVHRMRLHADLTTEAAMAGLHADLDAALGMLAPANVDAAAYACTAGSMVTPASSLPEALSARAGMPVVTTSAAIVEALAAIGAGRIAVATPYSDAVNAHEAEFLSAHGIECLAIGGLGIGAGGPHEFPRIARTPLPDVADHARGVLARAPGAEALLIACTDFPALPLIDALEAETGLPVVTSNSATLFAALRAGGLPVSGARGGGRLFALPEAAAA